VWRTFRPQKDEQALLLLLFGYKKSYGQDEVLATKLIASMQVSGLRPGRIDRTLAGFIELFAKVYVTD